VFLLVCRAQKVYWSENSANTISVANLDGSGIQMLTQVLGDSVGKLISLLGKTRRSLIKYIS